MIPLEQKTNIELGKVLIMFIPSVKFNKTFPIDRPNDCHYGCKSIPQDNFIGIRSFWVPSIGKWERKAKAEGTSDNACNCSRLSATTGMCIHKRFPSAPYNYSSLVVWRNYRKNKWDFPGPYSSRKKETQECRRNWGIWCMVLFNNRFFTI